MYTMALRQMKFCSNNLFVSHIGQHQNKSLANIVLPNFINMKRNPEQGALKTQQASEQLGSAPLAAQQPLEIQGVNGYCRAASSFKRSHCEVVQSSLSKGALWETARHQLWSAAEFQVWSENLCSVQRNVTFFKNSSFVCDGVAWLCVQACTCLYMWRLGENVNHPSPYILSQDLSRGAYQFGKISLPFSFRDSPVIVSSGLGLQWV